MLHKSLLEGKISNQFYHIQQAYIAGSPRPFNDHDWVKSSISAMLNNLPTQWLFRNITLHNKHQVLLAVTWKNELLAELKSSTAHPSMISLQKYDFSLTASRSNSLFLLQDEQDCSINNLAAATAAVEHNLLRHLPFR